MAVIKAIELVGTSPENWHSAVQNAVAEAAKTLRNITNVQVLSSSCEIENNSISQYRVQVKVFFEIDRVTG